MENPTHMDDDWEYPYDSGNRYIYGGHHRGAWATPVKNIKATWDD